MRRRRGKGETKHREESSHWEGTNDWVGLGERRPFVDAQSGLSVGGENQALDAMQEPSRRCCNAPRGRRRRDRA
jgi:hypothetical protein